MTAKIIVYLSNDNEGEYLAALLNGGIGNDDPARGPMSITKVEFFKSESIKPSWSFTPVMPRIETVNTGDIT